MKGLVVKGHTGLVDFYVVKQRGTAYTVGMNDGSLNHQSLV